MQATVPPHEAQCGNWEKTLSVLQNQVLKAFSVQDVYYIHHFKNKFDVRECTIHSKKISFISSVEVQPGSVKITFFQPHTVWKLGKNTFGITKSGSRGLDNF